LDISYNNFSGTLNKEWLSKLMGMIVEVSNETLVMEYYAYYGQLYHLGTKIRSKGSGNQFDKRWMTFGFIDRSNNTYQLSTELTSKGSERQFDEIWRTLGFLDVSNNAFQGSIPADIGGLVLLDVLNMSHNSFTGPIPSQLGHLAHLESLDLSSNALSGEIPLELASLDSLTTLNLSNNKLMGSIPESPHFMTFSNNSFLGNEDLCGPPLSKLCNNKVEICRFYIIPICWNRIWCWICSCSCSGMGNSC
jgi:hypothetical protein